MTKQRFRSLPLREAPNRVDRDKRIIYGVSAAQAVEALGHGFLLDATTLEQIVALGNKTKNGVGIKSRYTHPGLSSDGMGKQLGRMKNFRVENDKAVGDLHIYESASNTPSGDLAGHVMDLAEEDPDAFGMSIVFEGHGVWTLADGSEADLNEERPDNALTDIPVVRVDALDAVDVVDEPAANRDGMFSRALWGTNIKAEQMFGSFDELLAQAGMTPEQAWGYALKYFDARHVDLKGMAMENEATEVVEQADIEPTDTNEATETSADAQGNEGMTDELQALKSELAAMQERERSALTQATALQETVATMKKEAQAKRYQEMAAGWQGETAAHLTILEALGEGSEAFTAYKTLMSALSEQIAEGALFEELGANPQAPVDAEAKLEAEAKRIQAETGKTYEQAYDAALRANPDLVRELREGGN